MLQALGGLIRHLPGIALYGSPTVNSYKRFELDSFAPVNVSWGGDNRTVSIRSLVESAERDADRAAHAGRRRQPVLGGRGHADGDRRGIEDGDDPGKRGEGYLYGVGDKLPTTLGDAVVAARADTRITELLGQAAVDDLLLLSEKEWQAFTTQVSAWDIDRYLGAI